jgi:hypothetical protein
VINSDKGSTNPANCSQQVAVSAPAVVSAASSTTTPPPAPVLPNTGAGDVVGVFTGVSALGAAGHYAVRRWRR